MPWEHSGHLVEIMLWYPMSCCGEASMVVVCGVHRRLNIYTYIYNTIPTGNTSWWNIYVYKISIKVKLYHGETWACGPWYPLSSYIYIFVTWTHFPISMYLYIHVDTCSPYLFIFFSNLLFFKKEKDLPFSNICRPSSFAETNVISGNLINLIN